jgi:hypothetical protein
MNQQVSMPPAALPLAEKPVMSLDDVLSSQPDVEPQRNAVWPLPAVIVGTLVEIAADGQAFVDFDGNRTGRALAARSTGSVAAESVGSSVALLFENGDLARPIIMGLFHSVAAENSGAESTIATKQCGLSGLKVEAAADGERVTLTAEKEIELRCGKASITLTRAGKVIIRGAYLLSRSSGVNRIKGGSVQIN